MTPQQKILAFQLITGDYYLVQRMRRSGAMGYVLYQGNQTPVKQYSAATVNKFRSVLKTDSKNKLTINLNLVRQLHGKSHIKSTYKKLRIKI